MARKKIKTTLDVLFEPVDHSIVSTNEKAAEDSNIALQYFKRYFRTDDDYEDFTKSHYVVVDDWFEESHFDDPSRPRSRGQSRVLVFADNGPRHTRRDCASYPVEADLMFRKLNPKYAPAKVVHYYDHLERTEPTDPQRLYVVFLANFESFCDVVRQDDCGKYSHIFDWMPRHKT